MEWILVNIMLAATLSGCHSQSVNSPPQFSPSPSSFDVNENEIGEVLTTLHATDVDGDPIRFSIDIDDYFDIQYVDSNTVNVISTRGIDYERNAPYIEFTVTATDENSNSMTRKEISVNVRDINDNAPIFAQGGTSSFVIAEAVAVGYRIENAFTVTDEDTGSNAETVVSCFVDITSEESRKACDTFSLQTTRVANGNYSVDIIVRDALDFESVRSYVMTVDAVNTAPPSNFTRKNFVINVLDSQDQLPEFLKAPYSPSPWEEVPVGSVIDVVSVRDGDRESQPPRYIRLELLNDTRNWLNLSPPYNNSGTFVSNVTVQSRMDREEYHDQSVYIVAIRASELFPNGSVDVTSTASSYIAVQIFDINDNAPEFYTGVSRERLTAPLILDVEEGLGVNTNLPGFLLSVIDIDIPPNNQFSVDMEGFGNDTFQLSPQYGTGSVVLSLAVKKEANLDYEKPEYRQMQLSIIARDNSGLVNHTSIARVIINLIDKNDNSPYFEQGLYSRRVSPDVPIGSPLITVQATDADSGEFGRVTYSLRNTFNMIRINSETGTVYLLSHPEDGTAMKYEFELEVTDGGGLFSTAILIINFESEFAEGPMFDSHIYNATVYENRTRFINEPVRVRATPATMAIDEDSQLITYYIIAGNTPDQAFELHPTSGLLTLRRPLLKQSGGKFDLTVIATDGELNDTALIAVVLLDFNDHSPRFTLRNYMRNIPESTPVGNSVLNITATDGDGADEKGGRITYTILTGDNSQRFYLNPNTGELTVNAELDYDTERTFAMQVKAEDQGVPTRSAIAAVNIELTDINNKLPRFYNDPYVQYMVESAPGGSKVIQVNAFDLDRGSLLRYSIVSGSFTAKNPFGNDATSADFDFPNAFDIDELSGQITTRLEFDRDVVSYISFRVRVVDLNGEEPRQQQGFAQVQVTIREDGVGVPMFLNEPWTFLDPRIVVHINEETSGLIMNLVAIDSETEEVVSRFEEVAGDPYNLITVNIYGEVYLNEKLDYEDSSERVKMLVVEAVTSSGQASSATLEINVVNINDNSPEFSRDVYEFSLSEGTYVGDTPLGYVSVTDYDGEIDFYYQLTGKYSSIFYIDERGRVYIRNGTVINAEHVNRYNLHVEVSDSVTGGYSSSALITIKVVNSNEYEPVCTQPFSTFYVPKSTGAGKRFGQILATDEDFDDDVKYYTNSDVFAVELTTGAMYTLVPMSHIQSFVYELSVTARDSIRPYKEALCHVTIIVTTEDRSNVPIFITPSHEGAVYYLQEESADGTVIVTIEVKSPDNQRLDRVVYTLANIPDAYNFTIDPTSGAVNVMSALDRELQQFYELIVIATINNTEVSRKFYVSLTDIDDNDPDFFCNDLPYPLKLEVVEQQGGGEKVIGQIEACDADEPPNNKIYYHIVDCKDGTSTSQSERFSIDVETGEISADPYTMDYEISTKHVICVNATTSRISTSLRSQEWQVIIEVIDTNDHELTFTRSTVSVVMTASVGTGHGIVKIEASDADVVDDKELTYEIVSTEYIRGDLVVSGDNNVTIRSAFVIGEYNGKVTTNLQNYINLVGGRFIMKIRAKTYTESAELTLTVFVNDPKEQIILVIDESPEVVSKTIQDLFYELGEIHQLTFVVQKIEYHTIISTQQTDLNRTDVYLYVLDKDGNLVNSSYVAEILQRGYSDRQDRLYDEYDIIGDGPYTSAQVTRVVLVDWYHLPWIWWLIIISAIVLFIDALILICCLLYFYNRYVKAPSRKVLQPIYAR